jgi:hypothetical protein
MCREELNEIRLLDWFKTQNSAVYKFNVATVGYDVSDVFDREDNTLGINLTITTVLADGFECEAVEEYEYSAGIYNKLSMSKEDALKRVEHLMRVQENFRELEVGKND